MKMKNIKSFNAYFEKVNIERASATSKKLTVDNNPLKNLTVEEIAENLVMFREPTGNFMFAKGWTYMYLLDSHEAAEQMKKGEIDMLMFPYKGVSNLFSSPITDVWKKTKFSHPGHKHILGIIQGFTDEDDIYIQMMSVRKNSQRNGVNRLMIDFLRDYFPNAKLTFEDATVDGAMFAKNYPDAELKYNSDFTRQHTEREVEKRKIKK
jgi:hypothetical protein